MFTKQLKTIQTFAKKHWKILLIVLFVCLFGYIFLRESFMVSFDSAEQLLIKGLIAAYNSTDPNSLDEYIVDIRKKARRYLQKSQNEAKMKTTKSQDTSKHEFSQYLLYSHVLDMARAAKKLKELGKSDKDLLEYINQVREVPSTTMTPGNSTPAAKLPDSVKESVIPSTKPEPRPLQTTLPMKDRLSKEDIQRKVPLLTDTDYENNVVEGFRCSSQWGGNMQLGFK